MTYSRHWRTVTLTLLLSIAGTGMVSAQGQPLADRDGGDWQMGDFLKLSVLKHNSRSLRRTNEFLDVDRLDRQLQVAILVDGTDSMQAELESLQTNLRYFVRGLQEVKQDPIPIISVAVIIYRDTESPSGVVEAVIDRFEQDLSVVERELAGLHSENGAPYFREAVDQGLHYALTRLDWLPTPEAGVSRWIIVAGDAPPYPEGTKYRKHSTKELIEIAQQKQIAIYGMATGSGFLQIGRDKAKLKQTAEKERPDFRTFLGELAQATGGHTVDTLDANAVRYWMTHRQVMTPITAEDIQAVRAQGQATAGENGPLRIAVLPHLPLDRMSFESAQPEVVIATHLRDRLSRLGGVDVVSSADVQQAFGRIDAEIATLGTDKVLSALSESVQADYVVWGSQKTNLDLLVIETGLYKGRDGSHIATASESVKPMNDEGRLMAVGKLFKQFCETCATALKQRMNIAHAEVFAKLSPDNELGQELMAPLAGDYRTQAAILAGLDQMEQSLAFAKDEQAAANGDDPAAASLRTAIAHLEEALSLEPHNAYAHLLLADCYHNLSRHQVATDEAAKFAEHLELAYQGLEHLPSEADPIRLEIEAQYSLLIVKDIGAAIRLYRELAGRTVGQGGRFDLRSHWMLAGIHLGEWDTVSYGWHHVDPNEARNHVLSILAFWPQSPEARFYQKCIDNSGDEYLDVPVGDATLARTY